ncbi:butyrophilin subfamily 1 member A1-like [Acanthopagrus latus]|uniref:butyrophilin subfamily 1 member A1-like n=1 Tax=Acanthopagrus latus TaxID=8177 RepID=UPI00187C56D9|nr:butyrophilin subfamily 1 member A1-like [Acanthopagrus latus]
MLHPKTDGVSFSTFTVLLYLIFFIPCVGVEFKLVSSDQPIVALAGDDVILPCRLRPPIGASYMTVMWTKPGLIPEYVHFHQDGRLLSETQNPSYFLRTGLFIDELPRGNVSIKICRVKISDAGRYICKLPSMRKEAPVQLIVGAVSTPFIEVVSDKKGHVVLQCNSTGWYPEPEVFWLDGEGNLLSAGPTETARGPDDLYTVSSRVTVEKRHSNSFTCRVQQNHTNQTRETHIHVPADFITVQSSSPRLWIVLIVSTLCIIVIIILTMKCFFFCWRTDIVKRWRRRRRRRRRRSREETELEPQSKQEDQNDSVKNEREAGREQEESEKDGESEEQQQQS